MPVYNYGTDGNISNPTNIATPGAGASYLMYNFSGATAILDIELSAGLIATVTKPTGEQVVLNATGSNAFTIGEDEILHVAIANSTAGALGWRVNTAMSNHGTVRCARNRTYI